VLETRATTEIATLRDLTAEQEVVLLDTPRTATSPT